MLLRAGQDTLPKCSHRDRGIPCWNDEVESIRETAMFWHWLWVDNDRPRHGHVAAIMRKTRASYHYAVRQIKRRERDLRKSKMAESVSTNKQRDIWVETKKCYPERNHRLTQLMQRAIQKLFRKFLHPNTNNFFKVGETGASCYNFHSNSIFHKNMQARDYLLT